MKEREKEQERGDDSRHPYMKIEADTGESTAQLKPPELGQLNPIKQSWASSILLPLWWRGKRKCLRASQRKYSLTADLEFCNMSCKRKQKVASKAMTKPRKLLGNCPTAPTRGSPGRESPPSPHYHFSQQGSSCRGNGARWTLSGCQTPRPGAQRCRQSCLYTHSLVWYKLFQAHR